MTPEESERCSELCAQIAALKKDVSAVSGPRLLLFPRMNEPTELLTKAAVEGEREAIIGIGKGLLLELDAELGGPSSDAEFMRRLEGKVRTRGKA